MLPIAFQYTPGRVLAAKVRRIGTSLLYDFSTGQPTSGTFCLAPVAATTALVEGTGTDAGRYVGTAAPTPAAAWPDAAYEVQVVDTATSTTVGELSGTLLPDAPTGTVGNPGTGLLCSVDQYQAAVPGLTAAQLQDLPAVLAAATRAINTRCARVLPLAAHDECYAPTDTRVVRLKQYPVADIVSVSAGYRTMLTVRSTDASASRATAALAYTGQGDGRTMTGLTLASTVAGVASATTLGFAACPTLGALAAAIDGTAGWSAVLADADAGFASADLMPEIGAKGAIGTGAALWAFPRDVGLYEVDEATGALSIHEDFYPGHRYADRVWASSGRYGSVRVVYTAGYATVPDDLVRACIVAAKAIFDVTKRSGVVDSVRLADFSYTLSSTPVSLPPAAAELVAPYRRRRFA